MPRSRGRRAAVGTAIACALAAATAAANRAAGPAPLAEIPWAGLHLEPSGIAAVEGGYLIAEDELVGSVVFLPGEAGEPGGPAARAGRGRVVKLERPRRDVSGEAPRLFPVEDFEGLASDGRRTVYLLGSHSAKRDDEEWQRRPDREFIIRARWRPKSRDLRVARIEVEGDGKGGGQTLRPPIYLDLIDDLRAGGATDLDGLEAEGIALAGAALFVGLRAPLTGTGAAQLFAADEAALFGPRFDGHWTRHVVDLGGRGVRGLHWERERRRLLILAGPSARGAAQAGALWSYDPRTQQTEHLRDLPVDGGVLEGICRGVRGLLLVLDPAAGGRPALLHLAD